MRAIPQGSQISLPPMAAEGEFSVELDPNEIHAARLRALADLGMNRARIGQRLGYVPAMVELLLQQTQTAFASVAKLDGEGLKLQPSAMPPCGQGCAAPVCVFLTYIHF